MTVALTNPTAGFSGGITSSSTSTLSGPAGGANYAQMFTKAAKFGLQAYSFANELSAISDYKKTQYNSFAQSRRILKERAEFDTERIEIASFRLLKRQTAQASAGGFATNSASSLAIFNRTEIDKDRTTTQINKSLDDALAEIRRQEAEVRRKARGLKTKAIINFATSTLNTFGG